MTTTQDLIKPLAAKKKDTSSQSFTTGNNPNADGYSQMVYFLLTNPGFYSSLNKTAQTRLSTVLKYAQSEINQPSQIRDNKVLSPLAPQQPVQNIFSNISNVLKMGKSLDAIQMQDLMSKAITSDVDTFFISHPHVSDPGKQYATTQEYGVNPQDYKAFGGHEGYDIAIPNNEKINAPFDGKVELVDSKTAYGNRVRILNPKTGESYDVGHLNSVNVQPGQEFKKGDPLGLGGSTGRSTGPHLHINYIKDGTLTNPLESDIVRAWVKGITGQEASKVMKETQENKTNTFVSSTPEQYKSVIQQAENTYGVPKNILSALLEQESGWNPDVISGKRTSPVGALGIAQFMPSTAQEIGLHNPLDTTESIMKSAEYLKKNYIQFGDWDKALAAYNAGPGAVSKYGGIPPYKETQNYVKSITDRAKEATVPNPTQALLPGQKSIWDRLIKPNEVYASESQQMMLNPQSKSSGYMSQNNKIPTPSVASSLYSSPYQSYNSPSSSLVMQSKPPPSVSSGGGGSPGGGGGGSSPSRSTASSPVQITSGRVNTPVTRSQQQAKIAAGSIMSVDYSTQRSVPKRYGGAGGSW